MDNEAGKAMRLSVVLCLLTGCTSVMQIGKINLISNRNVETDFDYGLISSYAGGSDKEVKKTKAETIEQAIDQTVKKVPGGEFVMNASIFMVNNRYFAVQGDVWGRTDNLSYRGFAVGDRVTFKKGAQVMYGVIKGLKDDQTCYVQVDGTEGGVEVRYDILAKGEVAQ